jgi:Divergent InlB B-repeat domain/PASTA domain
VLADGPWMVGASGWTTNNDDAILDPSTLTWTTTGGAGRIEGNGEAGFTLLPNGEVLSVDVLPPACTTRTTEIFDPATLAWLSAGTTPTPLILCASGGEIGPQIMMYNGEVFVEGWTSATALYDTITGAWSAGPTMPVLGGQQYNAEDSGAALLPDGKVLVALNTGPIGQPPTHFFLFDGTGFTQVADNATSSIPNGSNTYMLLLPTGEVLYNPGLGGAGMEVFTDSGSPNPADAPTITAVPTQLAVGQPYSLAGLQLNGRSDGAAFGDDYQSSTDYPLVQITNNGTGTVVYARTFGMTNRSIAPEASSCTDFMLPNGIGSGASQLRVIANGIASMPVPVTVGSGGTTTNSCPDFTLATAKAGNGSGTVTSSQAGISCGATCSHTYPDGTIVTLTATTTTGSTFNGWSGGGCSGAARCIVTLNSQKAVTATFSLVPETLAVSKTGGGSGSVTSSPAGISCGTSCSHDFDYGTSVALGVSAAKGSSFHGWSGECSGTSDCVLTMTAASSVEASFVKDCVVPKLKGKGLKTARRTLKAHDCLTGKIKHAFSRTVKKGRVISQKPKPRKLLRHDARVSLVVSKGKKT